MNCRLATSVAAALLQTWAIAKKEVSREKFKITICAGGSAGVNTAGAVCPAVCEFGA
jgi:hypothetical protein